MNASCVRPNQFLTNPIKVVYFDPLGPSNQHTWCFIGDVPPRIRDPASARPEHLREFYGPNYRCRLGLDIRDWSAAYIVDGAATTRAIRHGGVDGSRTMSDEFDDTDIADLLKGPVTAPAVVRAARPDTTFTPGITYTTAAYIYPEDNFMELKEKIYLTTGIPVYRQHLWYIAKARPQTTYKMQVNGLYNVDIRRIVASPNHVAGVPVDKFLYDNRADLRIQASDTFATLETALTESIIYVTDLAQFTRPIRAQLMDMVRDTYSFELFYYGFVVKYWPMMTPEVWMDYVLDESELLHKYPDLAKSSAHLAGVYRAERDIIEYNYKNAPRACSRGDISIAVTTMVAYVNNPRVLLNIRNLFDKMRVSRCIPEIHAYVEHDGRRYLLRKRHVRNGSDIPFPSGALMKAGIIIAMSLRRADQESFHARSTISTMENEQSRYLFLNIHPSGRYYIRTVWNEEDEFGFDDILRIMKKFTDPIIAEINRLGRYVFTAGGELTPVTRQNIAYHGLGICIFWRRVMLESTFRVIRGLFESYLRGRIIGPRNVQQFDKYEFLFRKGMYEYNINAIERIITASNNITLNNYYAYLSNSTIKQKWDQNYDGRIVKMSHRTTDIRFEVNDIREIEFHTFYKYIVLFVHRALGEEVVRRSFSTPRSYKDVKKLRKLREQDPELFNLKKYGSDRTYSIICQNPRQPLIYTQDELEQMPAADKKRLTQYWNFTLNRPAWYGCPNKSFPHLSFMVGMHPKHYCLPCCNKKPQPAGGSSKKSRINAICLQKHKYQPGEQDGEGASRHVMGWGKEVDVGRLSRIPPAVARLFFGARRVNKQGGAGAANEQGRIDYLVFGVPQHTPGVENIGILYAVAEALDTPMETLVRRLIKNMSAAHMFDTMLNGTLSEYFASLSDLTASIKELFIDMRMFSRETQKFKQWPELFAELFHLLLGVNLFVLIDETGAGDNIDLFVSAEMRNEIEYFKKTGGEGAQIYVLLIKKQNRCYPIFGIEQEKYFKTFEIAARSFTWDSAITQTLVSIVEYGAQKDMAGVDLPIDLAFIREMCAGDSAWRLDKKYINRQNLCYAVEISRGPSKAYIPVNYSVYVADNVKISFTLDISPDVTAAGLAAAIEAINAHIREHYAKGDGLYTYRIIVPARTLRLDGGASPVGVQLNRAGAIVDTAGWYYYYAAGHTAAKATDAPYNYLEINRLILARTRPTPDSRTTRIGEALYNNYLYQLFIIEFINFLDKERNQKMRGDVTALITATNFKRDVGEFRKKLQALLADYPADYTLIQNQLVAFYYVHFNKTSLINVIERSAYDFDRITLNRLRSLPRPEIIAALTKIVGKFAVHREFDATAVVFPNIYMPCGEIVDQTGYCDRGRLIINKPIGDFIELLADDITDSLKALYLLNSGGDSAVDWLKFTKVPTEIITIYRLSA